MAELVKVTALRAFSRFVANHGIVHGDPDNSDEAARFPRVPASVVDDLVAEGAVEVDAAVAKSPKPSKAAAKPDTSGETVAQRRARGLAAANAARKAKREAEAAAKAAATPTPAAGSADATEGADDGAPTE